MHMVKQAEEFRDPGFNVQGCAIEPLNPLTVTNRDWRTETQ